MVLKGVLGKMYTKHHALCKHQCCFRFCLVHYTYKDLHMQATVDVQPYIIPMI